MSSQEKPDPNIQSTRAPDSGVYFGFAPVGAFSVTISDPQIANLLPFDAAVVARQEADLGHGLYREGKFWEATNRFASALRLQPRNAEYHYRFACAAWEMGDNAIVEKHLLESIHLHSTRVSVHQALILWY